jgi:hypothetical protein
MACTLPGTFHTSMDRPTKACTACASPGNTGGEVTGQRVKRVDQHRADLMQRQAVGRVLGQVPGLVLVDISVDLVGQQHHLAGDLAGVARLIEMRQRVASSPNVGQQCRAGRAEVLGKPAGKALGQEAGGAAGDVDEFAHQVAVHAQHEVFGVEVDVFVATGLSLAAR